MRECCVCDGSGWVIIPDDRDQDMPCGACEGTGMLA